MHVCISGRRKSKKSDVCDGCWGSICIAEHQRYLSAYLHGLRSGRRAIVLFYTTEQIQHYDTIDPTIHIHSNHVIQ